MPALANQKHERFCQGVASGLSETKAYIKVYGKCKSPESAASRLSKRVNVLSRLAELQGVIADAVVKVAIAEKEVRIRWADERHRLLRSVMEARAKDPAHREVPGGDTGTQILSFKALGRGAQSKVVTEASTDVALLAELRALEMQVAKELGQLEPEQTAAVTVNVVTTQYDATM